jgi:hypothetical protein
LIFLSEPSITPFETAISLRLLFRSKLTTQGINVQDILKLKASGIVTVLGIAQTPRKNLLKIKVSSTIYSCVDEADGKGIVRGKAVPFNPTELS